MKKYTIVAIAVVLVIGILSLLGLYRCPFRLMFGVPCPLCGMTRALYHAVRLEFREAFYSHALWPIAAVGLPLFDVYKIRGIEIKEKYKNAIIVFLCVTILGYYIIRHITGSPVVKADFHESLIYYIYKAMKDS